MMPKNIPTNDAPYEKKFRKNVDSSTLITIRRGNTTPSTIKKAPMAIMRVGVNHFIMVSLTNKTPYAQILARIPAAPLYRITLL